MGEARQFLGITALVNTEVFEEVVEHVKAWNATHNCVLKLGNSLDVEAYKSLSLVLRPNTEAAPLETLIGLLFPYAVHGTFGVSQKQPSAPIVKRERLNDSGELRYVNVFPVGEGDLPFVLDTLSKLTGEKGARVLGVNHYPYEERLANSPGAWLTLSRLEYDDFREVVRLLSARLEERLPEVKVHIFLLENPRETEN